MNGLQKAILAIGGIMLLANLAFPPWECRDQYRTVVTVARVDRQFVGNPPPDGLVALHSISHYVDWSLLGITSLAIVAGTGLLFALTVLFKDATAKLIRLFKWLHKPN